MKLHTDVPHDTASPRGRRSVRPGAPRPREEGVAAVELMLAMMPITFSILLLISLGFTLSTKQHSVVAARYSASYRVVNGGAPPPPELASAASGARAASEPWNLAPQNGNSARPNLGGASGVVLGVLNDVLSALEPNGIVGFEASTQPTQGLLPRYGGGVARATSRYYLVNGTWTCTQFGRSGYLDAAIGLAGDKVKDALMAILGSESCCDNYQN
jgi:hypothetical protein